MPETQNQEDLLVSHQMLESVQDHPSHLDWRIVIAFVVVGMTLLFAF